MSTDVKSSANVARRKVAYLLRPPEKRHRFGINSLVIPYTTETDSEASQVFSLFSGGRDGTIRGWSERGELLMNLEEHVDWVNDLLYLPSGVLVSCSSDTTVKVWNIKDAVSAYGEFRIPRGSSNTLAEHTDYVKALTAVDSHSGIVASGSLDGKIVIWDIAKGEYQAILGKGLQENTSIYCLASGGKSFGLEESSEQFSLSPEGSLIAAGSSDRIISLWDTRTRTRAVKLRGHRDIIRCLRMNEQGNILLSGSSDGSTRVWDLRNLRCMLSFDVHIDSVWTLAVNKYFDWFLSGGRDGAVWKTDLHTGESVLMIAAVEDESKYNHVLRVCMTPDEKAFWTSSLSSNIKYWKSDKCFSDVYNQNSKDLKPRTSHNNLRSVLSTSATDNPVFKEPSLLIQGEPGIVAKSVLNNRRHVLTCDSDGKVQLWDVSRGKLLEDFGSGRTMEEIQQEIDEMVVVPTWFHLVTRLGSLMVVLDPNICFAAEVYATDAGLDVDSDETKVNIGEHVLRGLFKRWHERYEKLLESSVSSFHFNKNESDSFSNESPSDSQRQDDTMNGSSSLPPYEFPEDIPIIIIEEGTTRPLLRKLLKDFDGTEASYLPDWVLKCVRDNQSMSREIPKLSFYLKPMEGSGFPALVQSKLTAPRILRAKKLATYVSNNIRTELERLKSKGGKLPFEFSPTSELEIVCRDQVVPPNMSLIAIRRFIWKSPEDLELFYRLRDEPRKRNVRR